MRNRGGTGKEARHPARRGESDRGEELATKGFNLIRGFSMYFPDKKAHLCALYLPPMISLRNSWAVWLRLSQRTPGPLSPLEPLERTRQYSFGPTRRRVGSTPVLLPACK